MEFTRTLLFVPANRERMLARAPRTGADAIVVDLEDAVPTTEKRAARTTLRGTLPAVIAAGTPVFVRVNNVRTGLARDDVMAAVRPGLAGVVHPKTEQAQDLRDLDVLLREAELRYKVRPGDIQTIPLIETPRGVLRCEEIALASDRVVALSVGGEDYTASIGVPSEGWGAALAHIRQTVVQVAAAYGLQPIDTPFAAFRDEAGLRVDAEAARALGFKGKYAVHPDQVAPLNEIFTPRPKELVAARRIVEAAEAAKKQRRGTVSVNGRMVDAPIVERARRLIALAASIEARATRTSRT